MDFPSNKYSVSSNFTPKLTPSVAPKHGRPNVSIFTVKKYRTGSKIQIERIASEEQMLWKRREGMWGC
jgi:hypothetical protein